MTAANGYAAMVDAVNAQRAVVRYLYSPKWVESPRAAQAPGASPTMDEDVVGGITEQPETPRTPYVVLGHIS